MNLDIEKDLLNNFPFEKKEEYNWKLGIFEKNINSGYEIYIFFGEAKSKKDNENIFVKNIKINFDKLKNYEAHQIIKEIKILISLQNQKYFPKLKCILKSNDNSNIYLIFKGNIVTLSTIINTKIFDYKKEKNLIKFIIYQITYGLYILHLNKIIHHNIKPSNILIDENANIYIHNFISSINKGEKSIFFSSSYSPPELFFSESKIDEKYDMWALGVIIIELYQKKMCFFSKNEQNTENGNDYRLNALSKILSKFELDEINTNKDSNVLMDDILNHKIKAKFKIEEVSKYINDIDAIDLIKNLLVINPKERFSAKQVLESHYLKDLFENNIFEIEPINMTLNYNENYDNLNNKYIFVKIIQDFGLLINKHKKKE